MMHVEGKLLLFLPPGRSERSIRRRSELPIIANSGGGDLLAYLERLSAPLLDLHSSHDGTSRTTRGG